MVHTMADSKASGFSKVVQKHSLRAKERFMQNFGKKDRTTDELFEIYQNNFNKQQASASRLQKELKNYATCAREMQAASKSLMECVADIYEPDWPGQEAIPHKAQTLELLWGDLCHKMNDQCTIPLSTYLSQFSEIRNKMDKRGRKLLDYDGCRHNLETIQSASKKRDDIKVAKAREQLEESRRLYEVLNKELHEELPALYDSRIPFFVNAFQTLFSAETHFHQEYSKVYQQFCQLIEQLAIEGAKGTFQSDANRYLAQAACLKSKQQQEEEEQDESQYSPTAHNHTHTSTASLGAAAGAAAAIAHSPPLSPAHTSKTSYDMAETVNIDAERAGHSNGDDLGTGDVPEESTNGGTKKKDELYDIPIGATTKDLPPGVLYKVKATYKYAAEDSDELSFESGEIIHVVQYEDPEEQEEGWLMGVRQATGDKGLFPANFTRPI